MNINGLLKTTLLDFPGRVACTVFTSGCNFRCPFCHNASLVIPEKIREPSLSEQDFFDFLQSRKHKLDGVCISGGEPLIHTDISSFISKIKSMGFEVKLDTNGSYPDHLKAILDAGLADYVAMDIKSAPDTYPDATGLSEAPIEAVKESVSLLMKGDIPFEFRTTLIDELHDEAVIRRIGEWVRGASDYYLQAYVDSDEVIRKGLHACNPEKQAALLAVLREYVPAAGMRGVE